MAWKAGFVGLFGFLMSARFWDGSAGVERAWGHAKRVGVK
jgi:hypothetical protein